MDNHRPKVSVIVPMYNVAPYLKQCLDSILSQTLEDFEAILIDDGSPDDSGKIADEYAAKDTRVKVLHKENQGVSAARNDGIQASKGQYLFLLDSDDYLSTTAFEVLYDAAKRHNADVVLSDYVAFSGQTETRYKVATKNFYVNSRTNLDSIQLAVFNMGPARIKVADAAILRGLGAAWHYLIKRDVVIGNSLYFDPSLALFDDGMFVLDVLECAKSAAYVSETTYYYRHVSNSITRSFKGDPFSRYADVYDAIEKFCAENNKETSLEEGLALRKLIYLNKSMETYFFNEQNPASESSRYKEFIEIVKSSMYSNAFKEINTKHLGCTNTLILLILLRLRLYKAYWLIKKRTLRQ